jgi:hypothetical protein
MKNDEIIERLQVIENFVIGGLMVTLTMLTIIIIILGVSR